MTTHTLSHALPSAEEVAIARESSRALSAFLHSNAQTQKIEIIGNDHKSTTHACCLLPHAIPEPGA